MRSGQHYASTLGLGWPRVGVHVNWQQLRRPYVASHDLYHYPTMTLTQTLMLTLTLTLTVTLTLTLTITLNLDPDHVPDPEGRSQVSDFR